MRNREAPERKTMKKKMRGYNIRKSCTKGPIFGTDERFTSNIWLQDDEIFGPFAHRMEVLLTALSFVQIFFFFFISAPFSK